MEMKEINYCIVYGEGKTLSLAMNDLKCNMQERAMEGFVLQGGASFQIRENMMYIIQTMVREPVERKNDFKIDVDKWCAEWIHEEIESEKFRKIKLPMCSCSVCDMYVERETDFCPSCGRAMNEKALEELKNRMR